MAPVTRSHAGKRKGSPESTRTNDSVKKHRPTANEDPEIVKFLKELKLPANFFQTGKCLATTLPSTDPTYQDIKSYIDRSKDDTGKAEILTILKITTNLGNLPKDDPKNTGKLRKMLWHGTPSRNVPKILEGSLKIPNKKSDPYFGVGIYFSDSFAYSLDYCDAVSYKKKSVVYLFLSDVLLGKVHKSYDLIPSAPKIKVSKSETITVESVQGCGYTTLDPKGDKLIDGCIWPLGKKIDDPKAPQLSELPENEYVVYEEWRARPKYLVKVLLLNDW